VALLIVYVGARAIIAGELSIGALIAATILAARALGPMRQVVGAWQQLQTVRAAFARLDELLNEPTERVAAPGPALRVRGHVVFEGVLYRYGADAGPALEGIDLEIAPGQVLGIAGPPGSGKSTFTKLLCGLDQPERGRILLDDLDLRLWSPAVLRQQIAVPQRCSCSRARSPKTSRSACQAVRASGRSGQVRRRPRFHPATALRL
jgi:ABC-type bacteriocin/lantibiotic exporter with double-glycine peptidase domain